MFWTKDLPPHFEPKDLSTCFEPKDFPPHEGRRGFLFTSTPHLKSEGCHLIPFPYFLSYFSAYLSLFLFCHFSANGPFSQLFFFSINSLTFFVEVRLFWFDSCWELGDDSWWYVQLAAIPHWNLPLCIYRTFLQFLLLLFLSIPFSSFFLLFFFGIRWNGCRYHHVLALCALLTGVILKELTCLKYL